MPETFLNKAQLTGLSADARRTEILRAKATSPTPWTAPTLLNSWANYGSGFQTAQYRKVGDVVYVRGLIQSGTGGIFTLPVGFRPPATLIFRQECATYKGCRIDINSAGGVILIAFDSGGSNAYVSLDGISFSVTA